jgi:phage shock protein A
MSILDRLNLLIRSNINDSMGRHGTSGARRTLSDMENSLRDARRQRVELKRGEAQLIRQIRETRETADQWEDRAMLALRRGEEDLAREALIVKNQAMREAQNLRDQLDDQRAYLQDIERALEALEVKLEGTRARLRASSSAGSRPASGPPRTSDWDAEMERRRRQREAQDRRPASPADPDVSERFDTSSSFHEMDRMANKIDSMEAEIEAMRELSGADTRRSELENIFRRVEEGQRTRGDQKPPKGDDDLSDLKKKFE